jgi:hypothetical protein
MMKASKLIVIALLVGLLLGVAVASVSAQSAVRNTPTIQGIIIVAPPPSAPPPKSDCNNNGIEDLDEFLLPDCWGKLTAGGRGD